MEINWVVVGWIIDMILNGFVWLIIAALGLSLIDVTDKWTRKALKLMDKVDKWTRKFIFILPNMIYSLWGTNVHFGEHQFRVKIGLKD